MAKQCPHLVFDQYADDAIAHGRREAEAQKVRQAIAARLKDCGLELHPEKTKIVYCKDEDRRSTYPNEKFDFLGYTLRPRRSFREVFHQLQSGGLRQGGEGDSGGDSEL